MENLTELESVILGIMNGHYGRENAIPKADLVSKVNHSFANRPFSERMVRKTLKHLVERHFERIGSCSSGYFMVTTEEERKAVCSYYHNYALSGLHIEARLSGRSMLDLVGQLKLEIGG